MSKPLILAIDFDGVICQHDKPFPHVGSPVPNAIEWLLEFKRLGAKMFLWTCRSNSNLINATNYLDNCDIKLDGYNNMKYNSRSFNPYPKLFANIYVDDAAHGAPLVFPEGKRAYLDWNIAGPDIERRIISKTLKL